MFRFLIFIYFFFYSLFAYALSYPLGTQDVFVANTSTIRPELLNQITSVINQSIRTGKYPGAIVLVSHRGQIIYRGVLGHRRVEPNLEPMTFDTIFDIASLTKVVATLPAIMQLLEEGKLSLDDKVCKYASQFCTNDKAEISIRELLTHTSGLPATIAPQGKTTAAVSDEISKVKLINHPGTAIVYSDLNFIVLAHLVELISHDTFKSYTQNHIFKLLGMNNTQFLPSANIRQRIAPTEEHWGATSDPMARVMGGIAGNAGLFSTASDLGNYADCLLRDGRLPQPIQQGKLKIHYLLGPLTVLKMTSLETPAFIKHQRGLGWDIDSTHSVRGDLLPLPSYGHTGWTGTSLWIDPNTATWVLILTSRTHPHPISPNVLISDRKKIANIVAGSLTDISTRALTNVGTEELARAYPTEKKKNSFWKWW